MPDAPLTQEDMEVLAAIAPHALIDADLPSALLTRAERIEAAMMASVASGEMKPAARFVGLDGSLSPRDTWLQGDDVEQWAYERRLRLREVWDQYRESEADIYFEATFTADAKRTELEWPQRLQAARRQAASLTEDEITQLIIENIELREGAAKDAEAERPLLKRERTALLNVIGGMLELLQSPRPDRDSDAAVIRELVENYGEKYGISQSNLERRFPEAKRTLRTS